MKRIVSYLLAAVLVLTPCVSSYATEPGSTEPAPNSGGLSESDGQNKFVRDIKESDDQKTDDIHAEDSDADSQQTTEDQPDGGEDQPVSDDDAGINAISKEEPQQDTQDEPEDSEEVKGQVDVYIAQTLEWEKPVVFTVTLNGQSKTITLPGGDTKKVQEGVTFDGLSEGAYSLRISAPGFADYTQQIQVKDWAYKLSFATGFLGGYGEYTAGGKHPGVLLIGDVDGDRVISEADEKLLVDLIDAGKEAADTKLADLNGDGRIDLTDLEYFVQGYKVTQDISSLVEVDVPSSAIQSAAGAGTKVVKGELGNLFKGEGSVELAPENGAEITEGNPVTLEFEIPKGDRFPTGGIVIDSGEDNPIHTASVDITYTEGTEDYTITVPVSGEMMLLTAEPVNAADVGHGRIIINLGSQVAVKKVTLKITGMKKNNNLAEISRVEFVNDMENRIPEPQRDIPEELEAKAGNKTFTLNWKACVNVTGYEVQIEDEAGQSEVVYTKGNMLTVSSFMQEKLTNGKEYKVRVQSVNGAWRSGYCEPVTVIPKVDKVPDAPDNVSAEGRYRAVGVSWKKMKDTDSYCVYYRESGTEEYTRIEGITASSYTITELKDKTEYEIYVTGVNELGESKPSLTAKAETTDQNPAQMPKYKLLNLAGEGEVSSHIISAAAAKGTMNDSPLDTEAGTAWGTVDNNPMSHYAFNSWDGGGFNSLSLDHGVTYEFDEAYKMDRIALQEVTPQSQHYGYAQIRYWDGNGQEYLLNKSKVRVLRKTDSENRPYYLLRLSEPIEAKKIQIGLARTYVHGTISMSEVYFYYYDSIEEEIMALYEDDLHTVLRSDVTQASIDELRGRINTPDEVSGEYHPDKDALERELKTAEDILNSVLTESVSIHNEITTKDVGRGFGGLNAWQPLGVTAAAGEEITVYVGHNTKKTGETTNLQLVCTQYHSEANSMFKAVSTLKIGRNDITVPKLWSIDAESGGALYVQYTGSNANDHYAVRVSGGVQVPRLDLYKTDDSAKRQEKAELYLTELDEYIKSLPAKHDEVHKNSENKLVKYDYRAQDCILGASDIMLDTMMLSLPAQQISAGTGTGSIQERAGQLVASMDAVENMMGLFYQHKGLNNTAEKAIDRLPANHLNIRYQRMFAGAFMYASGNHIGIEWNETKGMMNGTTVVADESGKYKSGRYFGWGIAHEIGHCINQGTYAIAEITNNYYSVLAQAKDTNDSVRFKYEEVYKKVTSGTKGRASNVFTQLGMYWQLHLAYDNGLNYKTYPDYNEQLSNLFFARVDTYARTLSRAPKPGDVALVLAGDKDQDLMRLSCAAAEKNILEFFERWGMTPNQETIDYAGQFPKETRAICYVNDESRVYRLSHSGSSLGTEGKTEAVGDGTAAVVNKDAANKVEITLASKNIAAEDILGYEIVRCTTSNGETEREVAGFTTGASFTDVITTLNNRVVTYEITLIDKYLNRSAVMTLPELKIRHDGDHDKSYWTVSTKDMEAVETTETGEGTEDDPCGPEAEAPVMKAFDDKTDTVYTGKAGANAEVIMEFNHSVTVSGFRYTAGADSPVKEYSMYVRNDADGSWIEAAAGTLEQSDKRTVYFGKGESTNIALYQTTAMKLAIKNQQGANVTIAELDVFGVTGDNVEFRDTAAIGKLSDPYQYGKDEKDVIPADSIVFTGSYKGNSAYNVVILYDQDGNIVGGVDEKGDLNAYQVIFSDVSEEGDIEDTYDGTWIYWIDPKDVKLEGLQKVRAELYRVDDAMNNTGQRLVSDTMFETVPETLPDIQLSGKKE